MAPPPPPPPPKKKCTSICLPIHLFYLVIYKPAMIINNQHNHAIYLEMLIYLAMLMILTQDTRNCLAYPSLV